MSRIIIYLVFAFFMIQLTGCSTTGGINGEKDCAPNFHIDVKSIPDAVPTPEPYSKYGNPRTYKACGHRYYVKKTAKGYCEKGIASWYGMKFHRVRTSSGELYDVRKMTAAHCTLPIPTYVLVTNLKNGRHVVVKVNDRGPFVANRLIDLSYCAAVKLGVTPRGTALVEVRAIDPCRPQMVCKEIARARAGMGHPHLYLQMGAFSIRENAEKLANEVRENVGYTVNIKAVEQDDSTLYKVQIGPIPDVGTTDKLSKQIKRAGLGRPYAVVQ